MLTNIKLRRTIGMIRWGVLIWTFLATTLAIAQITASLATAETQIRLEADPQFPRLLSVEAGSSAWANRAPETPPPAIEIDQHRVSLKWQFNDKKSRIDRDVIAFVYDSTSPHLRLTWEWSVRSQHGPIEHEIRIENLDSREIWLPVTSSFVFDWKVSPQESLEHFYVEKGADTPSSEGTHLVPLATGYKWEGTSSTYAQPRPGEAREIIPFFLVEHTSLEHTPSTQSAWYVGVEFSGRIRLSLSREEESLHGEVGLNPSPAPVHTLLKPGDVFETPRIFLGASSNGLDAASNVVRRWVRDVLGNPNTWKDPRYPLMVNNSWGSGMAVDEAAAKRMIRDASDLGLEMFHLDAGWFRGVGDWYPDAKKFPSGLQPLADEAHARGLKFGLWADWSQAGLDTAKGALNARDPMVRKWLTVDPPVTWKPEAFKGVTVDIGVPAAREWITRETDRIVTDYHLDMLEHDGYLVAKGCDASNHPHAAPDPLNKCTYQDAGFPFVLGSNSTDVSYHAVRAYYDIQSHLRRQHPGLLLEICNDGGRMVDFGSAAHGDYFSITDTYDPLSNRRAFYDTSYVLPSAMLEAYVERWPTPRIENFRYMLRSGMMGWPSVMIDTTTWNSEQRAAAKEEFQLFKSELRPLIREADLYHISERPDGEHWDGMEYFDPQTQRGAIYAFRGSLEGEEQHGFRLKGLDASASYRLHFHDGTADGTAKDQVVAGSILMTTGLTLRLPGVNSSEIILLQIAK